MSKAFVNKDQESENTADDDREEEGEPLPTGTKNYMTPAGAERLQKELQQLMREDRPKVVATVQWAASNGDRSENADYQYGKRRLREIDRRVRFLNKRLDFAEVVDPSKQKGDRILFGATVTLVYEDGEKKTYRIVGIDETNITAGDISWRSPIGQSLLTHKVGDVILFRTPKGEEEIEILKIEYR